MTTKTFTELIHPFSYIFLFFGFEPYEINSNKTVYNLLGLFCWMFNFTIAIYGVYSDLLQTAVVVGGSYGPDATWNVLQIMATLKNVCLFCYF